MPGRRRTAAEAKDIQGQRLDFVVWVFANEAVAGCLDVFECLPHLARHPGGTESRSAAEQVVLFTALGANARDVDPAMGQPGCAIGRNLWRLGIQLVQQFDVGHTVAVAAFRVANIGFAARLQVLLGDRVLGAAEQAQCRVGGIVVGAAEAQDDALFYQVSRFGSLLLGRWRRRFGQVEVAIGQCIPLSAQGRERRAGDQQPVAVADLLENPLHCSFFRAVQIACAALPHKFFQPRRPVVTTAEQGVTNLRDGK
ncbi:hypothetical protein D9M69_492720 [compost metagenome]